MSQCKPEQWIDQHGDYLYRYALARLRNPDQAEEIVQETFVTAFEAQHTFEGKSSERTWLTGILKHKIIDYFRKTSRELPPAETYDVLSPEDEKAFLHGHWSRIPIDWTFEPHATFEMKQFWKAVDRCISELPPRHAQAFILREIEELNTEEICQILNVTRNNLWVMLHRARMHLRRCLEEEQVR